MISHLTGREEYLKKKRNKKILKYGIIFALLVVIISSLAYISRRPQFVISSVEFSGGVIVTQADIESATLGYIHGNYLWVFPIGNALWYPRGELAKYLKESFKRIDTINIHLKNSHTLAIDITERKPVAIWCDTLPNEARPSASDGSTDTSTQKCYFMDSNSEIFAEAPSFSGDAYFKYYGLLNGDNPIGQFYISSSTEFAGIAGLVESAKNLSLRPQYIVGKSDGQFSLVVLGGGQIYFDTIEPLSETTENLNALLKTSVLSSSGIQSIDYIDLRFGNKLFYKLKQ